MIENEIRLLLTAPSSGTDAPSLARIEDALTTGYAHAMALQAEEGRIRTRISDLAVRMAEGDANALPADLRELSLELKRTEAELVRLRTLLGSLRMRAAEARAA
jgi:hypothetical protein